MKYKAILSWSSGKDSAWALAEIQRKSNVEVVGLVTTVNGTYNRVAMHAVREKLLNEQAKALGLPLTSLYLPYPCSNDQYQSIMAGYVNKIKEEGISYFIFGDIFLEDIRQYREHNLLNTGLKALFPLWGANTSLLASQMVSGGLEAVITCIDPKKLSSQFAGRQYNADFLQILPEGIDPCGENGEFHTFVTNCPSFSHPVQVRSAQVVERDGFYFADLLPGIIPKN